MWYFGTPPSNKLLIDNKYFRKIKITHKQIEASQVTKPRGHKRCDFISCNFG